LSPNMLLANKYAVVSRLGAGWEGEVYLIREVSTGIERTAKLFFPYRNQRDVTAKFYAKKLHKLRHCPIIIQYSTQEFITIDGLSVTMLVSEYVEGELLSQFIARQPNRRLSAFAALHLLHALASGMESIHASDEYHGDLHSDNVIIQRYGLSFDLKLVDFFRLGAPKKEYIRNDVIDLVFLFHEALGGRKHYAKHPPEVKAICCGLKHSLITKKFKHAGRLRQYIETMEWR
ncbi:MAG: serine/threonine protein kinase domain-containing protein, partial [Halothiobacillaceae bacterium]